MTVDHCKLQTESALHALWECSEISAVWDSFLELKSHQNQCFSSDTDLIIHAHEKKNNLNLMTTILWIVWHRGNQIRTLNKDYPITQVVRNAKKTLQDFHNANMVQSAQVPTSARPRVRWKPPPEASLKVIFDGATLKDIRKVGLGDVIQNSSGQVLASLSEQVTLPHISDIVEALAAAGAVSLHLNLASHPLSLKETQRQ